MTTINDALLSLPQMRENLARLSHRDPLVPVLHQLAAEA
jgi:hypothetical protein